MSIEFISIRYSTAMLTVCGAPLCCAIFVQTPKLQTILPFIWKPAKPLPKIQSKGKLRIKGKKAKPVKTSSQFKLLQFHTLG